MYKNIYNKGDLNNDFIINIQDLMMTIEYVLSNTHLNQLNIWISDFDDNFELNIQDVILMVNIILN